MREFTIKVHSIAEDGLPDMEALVGRVAFIFDGCIVSGWPLFRQFGGYEPGKPLPGPFGGHERGQQIRYGQDVWEANTDVGHNQPMAGVTHWVEFPVPVWELRERNGD